MLSQQEQLWHASFTIPYPWGLGLAQASETNWRSHAPHHNISECAHINEL